MAGLENIMKAIRFLPASVAVKALQKFNPKFKNYFANAVAYGFDVNNALDYLKNKFEGEHSQGFRQGLESREGQLRPDEQISLNRLRQAEMPGKVVRGLASVAGGALLGGVPGATTAAAGELAGNIPQEQPEHIPGLGQLKAQHGPPSPREQSLKRHAKMTKEKRLIDKLMEEHEREYGSAPVQPARTSESIGVADVNAPSAPNFKGLFGGIAGDMTSGFYKGVFDALKKGKNTFAGVKEPLIAKAKPYFEKGLIQSPDDIRDFANQSGKFGNISQQTGGQSDADAAALEALNNINQALSRLR